MLDWIQFTPPPADIFSDESESWLAEDIAAMRIATQDFAGDCLKGMSDKQVSWMQGRLKAGKTPLEIGREVFDKTGKYGDCYRAICAAAELEKKNGTEANG